jgi:hypothetical protein
MSSLREDTVYSHGAVMVVLSQCRVQYQFLNDSDTCSENLHPTLQCIYTVKHTREIN